MKARWMLAALLCIALLPFSAKALYQYVGPSSVQQNDRDHDRDHDWEHDKRFEGRRPAYRNGFREGFGDGRSDREAHRRWHYGLGHKHPDHGYRDEFGNKREYQHEFREGYEQGYKEGFGDRR